MEDTQRDLSFLDLGEKTVFFIFIPPSSLGRGNLKEPDINNKDPQWAALNI